MIVVAVVVAVVVVVEVDCGVVCGSVIIVLKRKRISRTFEWYTSYGYFYYSLTFLMFHLIHSISI